eukprot:288243-Prorocentrum_minimum.AAC.8
MHVTCCRPRCAGGGQWWRRSSGRWVSCELGRETESAPSLRSARNWSVRQARRHQGRPVAKVADNVFANEGMATATY